MNIKTLSKVAISNGNTINENKLNILNSFYPLKKDGTPTPKRAYFVSLAEKILNAKIGDDIIIDLRKDDKMVTVNGVQYEKSSNYNTLASVVEFITVFNSYLRYRFNRVVYPYEHNTEHNFHLQIGVTSFYCYPSVVSITEQVNPVMDIGNGSTIAELNAKQNIKPIKCRIVRQLLVSERDKLCDDVELVHGKFIKDNNIKPTPNTATTPKTK